MESGIQTPRGNSRLIQKIRSEINRQGLLTFARFMDLALYDTQDGYYMTSPTEGSPAVVSGKERIGWSGDFFTAPDLFPLLAKAMFKQIQEIDHLLDHPPKFTILEMGGGKGFLARDLLRECEAVAPEFLPRLTYQLVECSPSMRALQEYHLLEFIRKGCSIEWSGSLSEFEEDALTGIVVSNEFIDALPIHRVTMQGGSLKEVFVDCGPDGFEDRFEAPSTMELSDYLNENRVTLSDTFMTEIHLEARHWMQEVARVLGRGFVLTIDYGHTASDYYGSARRNGTLLCYYQHTVSDNPYNRIGEQDITAHVNFSDLALTGERTGLSLTGYTNLLNFLLSLGAEQMLMGLDQESKELQSAIPLLRPNGMGETFKVLIQHKRIDPPSLQGLRFRPFFEGALFE